MFDLEALVPDRWARAARCRQNYDQCPHSERHWHPQIRRGRFDIQGLRALAVSVVILDHLTGWPGGGFVGVDIFFVISGFLITGLLVREHEGTGHISFVDFYRRRFLRIMPAAVTVLLATTAVSYFIFYADRWRDTAVDATWALLFSANWHFQAKSTNYFEANGPVSPFQHYWSLSIEEQFYFVWPWLMLLAFTLLLRGRSARAHRIVAFAMIAGISTASFVWALYETTNAPASAYFSTFTRVWELGVGAMLALASPVLIRAIPDVLRPLLAWVGLVGMISALWMISPDSDVPAPAMLWPVGFAALFIASGTRPDGEQQPLLWPMTNRPVNYIGDISYSLYLWHFPAIVLTQAVFGDGTATFYATALSATIALSVISFHLVEDPMRHAPFLSRFDSERRRSAAFSGWNRRYRPRYKAGSIIAVVAVSLAIAGASLVPPQVQDVGEEVSYDIAADSARGSTPVGDQLTAAEKKLQADIAAALNTPSWPKLEPSLDTLETAGAPEEDSDGCGNTDLNDPNSCRFGDPSKPTLVVLGDSTGITLLPTVRAAFGDDYYIRGMTMAGCPFPVDKDNASTADQSACDTFRENAIAQIRSIRPDAVFMSTVYAISPIVVGADQTSSQTIWQEGAQAIVDQFSDRAKQVILVAPAVNGPLPQECATRLSAPNDCEFSIPSAYRTAQAAEKAVTGRNVHYLDTSSWYCVNGRCPAFVGTTPLRRDDVHVTRQWAVKMAPFFKADVSGWISGSGDRARWPRPLKGA